MPDLQHYPWNLNLNKNVEDIVVFLTQQVFISISFFVASHKQEMRLSYFHRETANEKNSLKKQKH